jgi:hypothetical protein
MNISCVSATTPRNAKAKPASRWSSRPALTGGRLDWIVVSRLCFRAISRSIAGVLFSGKEIRGLDLIPRRNAGGELGHLTVSIPEEMGWNRLFSPPDSIVFLNHEPVLERARQAVRDGRGNPDSE